MGEKGPVRTSIVYYIRGQPLMQTLNIKRPSPLHHRHDNKPRMLLAIQLDVDDHRFGIFRHD